VQLANERSPMLRREQLMVSRSEAAIDVARREFKPDFALSGGYYYGGSMPDMYEFRFDVVIPLQRARRRAAVAEQESLLAAARSTYDSSRLSLQGRLQEDYQMATTAGQLATLFRDTVLPQARLALESSLSSYQTGAVDFLSVLTNFGSVLQYEMSYVEQLTDVHVAASRIEEMAGVTLLQ
jgi:outer membrane protein TolC